MMNFSKMMKAYNELDKEDRWTDVSDTLSRIKAASTPYRWKTFVHGMRGYRHYCHEYNGWGETPYISAIMENYCRALNHEYALLHNQGDRHVLGGFPNFRWWLHFYNFRIYLDGGGRPYWPLEFDIMHDHLQEKANKKTA